MKSLQSVPNNCDSQFYAKNIQKQNFVSNYRPTLYKQKTVYAIMSNCKLCAIKYFNNKKYHRNTEKVEIKKLTSSLIEVLITFLLEFKFDFFNDSQFFKL